MGNIEPRLWPRAPAAAQQFWSGGSYDVNDVSLKAQLMHFRCFMVSRGIPAQPIGPGGYCPGGEWDDFRNVDPIGPGVVSSSVRMTSLLFIFVLFLNKETFKL